MSVLAFDVNETLLDVKALLPDFRAFFDDDGALAEWFGQLLRNSWVATITGTYAPFDVQGTAALATVARRRGVDLGKDDATALVAKMAELPPHPDVIPALERLRDAGLRMVTLTNSAPSTVAAQVSNAGIDGYFEMLLSVEPVGLFKPAPETYHYAAARLGVGIAELRLVAAHDWDVTGAMRAGAKAAFVARPGALLGELSERPDMVAPDLGGIADQLLAAG